MIQCSDVKKGTQGKQNSRFTKQILMVKVVLNFILWHFSIILLLGLSNIFFEL